MFKASKLKWIVSVAVVATLSSGIAPAVADDGVVSDSSRVVAENRGFDSRVADASDADLMALLLTGTGPIAEAHPELPQELGFSQDPMPVDAEGLKLVIDTFISKSPDYTAVWAPAIKSGDPVKINKGLNGFMEDFIDFVENDAVFSQYRDAAADAETHAGPRLYAASGGTVAVWNVAIAVNAAVVATTFVAAATVAAGAMAIVLVGGVFIAYLDDVEGGNAPMDMNNVREGLVSSLAS